MSTLLILYTILLFFLLTPGILVTLPIKSSKTVVALTHAIVFGIVYHFTHNLVSKLESFSEGLDELPHKLMQGDTSSGGNSSGMDGTLGDNSSGMGGMQGGNSSGMGGMACDTSSGIPTGMQGGKQTDLSSNSIYP